VVQSQPFHSGIEQPISRRRIRGALQRARWSLDIFKLRVGLRRITPMLSSFWRPHSGQLMV